MTDKKPGRGVRPGSLEALHRAIMEDIRQHPNVGWACVILGQHAHASDTQGAVVFGSYGDSFLGATVAAAVLERNVRVAGQHLDFYDTSDDDEGDDANADD